MISTNKSTASKRIWTNSRAPLCPKVLWAGLNSSVAEYDLLLKRKNNPDNRADYSPLQARDELLSLCLYGLERI